MEAVRQTEIGEVPKVAGKTIRIQQVRSAIGRPKPQREVLRSLGLRRIRHVVEREDTQAVRGMVRKIPHLVQVLED
ncbi:MAG: 50S ribosomal protein L30 [Acidobacteriota bacterium]|nr:50S ribosomal protein L30 [Acidobacteriota bacterium]